MRVSFTVNGERAAVEARPDEMLIDVLERLGVASVRETCGIGVCGACTVLLDGAAVDSCLVMALAAAGSEITTVEGLASGPGLHDLQESFKRHHALQCGFCTPGFLLTIVAADPAEHADEVSVRELLGGNLCRCTGYQNIVDAVRDYWGRE